METLERARGPEGGASDGRTDAAEAWRARWQAQGQPWRTEPEIPPERQAELAARLRTEANVWESVYPLRDVKLSRADVEWLLATHHRPGASPLDLRGADLRKADLSELPLDGVRAGLELAEWQTVDDEQRDAATAHFERANLRGASLAGALLVGAALTRANLTAARLDAATLAEAHLEHANLHGAQLTGAVLARAHLDTAELTSAQMRGADAHEATFAGATLNGADLAGAILRNADFQKASLRGVYLGGGSLTPPDLERLRRWRPTAPARLEPADLRGASFDTLSDLFGMTLGEREYGFAQLADVRWGDTILTVVHWGGVNMLGDERIARERAAEGDRASRAARIAAYETAIRANRQLAIALTAQGLTEHAVRFNYRAQVLNRQILWWQVVWGQSGAQQENPRRLALGQRANRLVAFTISLLLDLLSGYGSKLGRIFVAYIVAVLAFATGHYIIGRTIDTRNPLTPLQAIAMSIQSLHGRNFTFQPTSPQIALNTAEAIVGLIIEALVVAVITRRILGLG